MNKKSAPRAAAVIEIGSNNVRMRVSQWAKGTVATLDRLEYPVSLGHDVFSSGDISFDSLRELSSVLSKFTAALRSYNIEKPKVISCTALREAKNRALVVDQLKVRNGLEVTVLEDSQEKAYIYKEVMERLDGAKLHPGNTMIAYVGSGSIGVAVYDGQKIIYTQNISMGALKLHDVLRHLHHQEADDFYYIIEEYLDTILNRIAISRFQVKNLVLTGSQLELVAQLCEAKKAGIPYQISVKKLTSLYQSIRSATAESIANRFNITEERAALLYTSLSIYNGMLRFCPQAENVISPPVDISEAMLRYQLVPKADATLGTYLRESALACAQTKQFCCFIGDEGTVEKHLRELEILAEKEKRQEGETFADSVIMYEVLSELKEIAARPGGITCACGSSRYGMEIRRSAVDLICRDCGKAAHQRRHGPGLG